MKANDSTITDPASAAPTTVSTTSVRRGRRFAAVGVIALLGLASCTSDPGANRVARDIVEAQAIAAEEAGEDFDEQCMLDVLKDDFSEDDLTAITDDLNSANTETRAEGQAALDAFEAALASCN